MREVRSWLYRTGRAVGIPSRGWFIAYLSSRISRGLPSWFIAGFRTRYTFIMNVSHKSAGPHRQASAGRPPSGRRPQATGSDSERVARVDPTAQGISRVRGGERVARVVEFVTAADGQAGGSVRALRRAIQGGMHDSRSHLAAVAAYTAITTLNSRSSRPQQTHVSN